MDELARRLSDKVNEVGWAAIPRAAMDSASFRFRSLLRETYIEWILRSRLTARMFPFRSPTILLLAHPRSGSSWVGDLLAQSRDIAYLREPITRVFETRFGKTISELEHGSETRQLYQELADRTFVGVPVAGRACLPDLAGFALRGRLRRHLLIKEVNPLAAEFYVERYAPKVLLLLRHPAAIAESFDRLGWLDMDFEQFGYSYGHNMRKTLTAISEVPHKVVHYEDLAADPEGQFAELFDFIGVNLPPDYQEIIREFCHQGEPATPFGTRRMTSEERDKWKTNLRDENVNSVMLGVSRSGFCDYKS